MWKVSFPKQCRKIPGCNFSPTNIIARCLLLCEWLFELVSSFWVVYPIVKQIQIRELEKEAVGYVAARENCAMSSLRKNRRRDSGSLPFMVRFPSNAKTTTSTVIIILEWNGGKRTEKFEKAMTMLQQRVEEKKKKKTKGRQCNLFTR